MARRTLSKREIKDISSSISPFVPISPKQKVEIVTRDKCTIMYLDDKPILFEFKDRWLPLLRLIIDGSISVPYKKVTVDMGAIKFVSNGADIMRPGVSSIEDGIEKDDLVLVVDENHGKILALGIALLDSSGMRSASGGKIIKNAHAAGDVLWELTA